MEELEKRSDVHTYTEKLSSYVEKFGELVTSVIGYIYTLLLGTVRALPR
jgi:hypothetical protein